MKKRWLIVPVAIGMLAVGVFSATVASAAGPGGDRESRISQMTERVAEILGLDQSAVQDAYTQAREELRMERLNEKLAAAVEAGTITQEQADAYVAWVEAKPDGIHVKGRNAEAKLAAMVEAGEITQEQADEYTAWMESRPEGVELGKRGHGKRGRGFHRGGRRGFERGGFGNYQPTAPAGDSI